MFKVDFPVTIVKHYTTKSAKDAEKWIIEGYAATDDYDLQGDIISSEAIKASENDLLENSTVLYNHSDADPIGKVLETKFTPKGLWIKVLISKTVPDTWEKIQEGVLNKFSISAKVLSAKKEFVEAIGRVANIIEGMLLVEVSLVSVPANPKAKAIGWYVSKALQNYEQEGGEIPMDEDTQKRMSGSARADAFKGAATDGNPSIATDDSGTLEGGSKAEELPTTKEEIEAKFKEKAEKEGVVEPKKELAPTQEEAMDLDLDAIENPKVATKVTSDDLKKALEKDIMPPVEKVEKKAEESKDSNSKDTYKGKKSKELLQMAMRESSLDRMKELISRALNDMSSTEVKKPTSKPKKKPEVKAGVRNNEKEAVKKSAIVDKPAEAVVSKGLTESDVLALINAALPKAVKDYGRQSVQRKGLVTEHEPVSGSEKVMAEINDIQDPAVRLKKLIEIQMGQ